MPVQALLKDHARIIAAVEANVQMISGHRPKSCGAMAQKRWAFTRGFLMHCARDDAQVLRALTKDCRPDVAAAAARLRDDLGSLVNAFKAHVQRWPRLATEVDWPTYVSATTTLMEHIRERLHFGEQGLYRHLPVQPKGSAVPPACVDYANQARTIREVICTRRAVY